ncbi:MAG TPA: hypothetical protein VLN08_06535 [Vicinamibacterales bacterium]|nr:hypothetical protein [Vicinamibacterales bacterium]
MFNRVIGVALAALISGACQQSSPSAPTPAGPTAAAVQAGTDAAVVTAGVSAASAKAAKGERPFKATAVWNAGPPQWAGNPAEPGYAPGLFGGRCSVPSDYVITAAFEGDATHAGHVTGSTSHCSQILWGPGGALMGATYSDGRGIMHTANGSTLILTYGNGETGFDPDTGLLWFRDQWTFIGGTGHFAGATGSGVEGGSFASFDAILSGAPVPMWMEGTITYDPSRK